MVWSGLKTNAEEMKTSLVLVFPKKKKQLDWTGPGNTTINLVDSFLDSPCSRALHSLYPAVPEFPWLATTLLCIWLQIFCPVYSWPFSLYFLILLLFSFLHLLLLPFCLPGSLCYLCSPLLHLHFGLSLLCCLCLFQHLDLLSFLLLQALPLLFPLSMLVLDLFVDFGSWRHGGFVSKVVGSVGLRLILVCWHVTHIFNWHVTRILRGKYCHMLYFHQVYFDFTAIHC